MLATPVDGNAGVNQKNGIVVADARLRTNKGLDLEGVSRTVEHCEKSSCRGTSDPDNPDL
jgi:hypothetical protein